MLSLDAGKLRLWLTRLRPSSWLVLACLATMVIAVAALWGARPSTALAVLLFGAPSLVVALTLLRRLGFGWGPTLVIGLSLVLYVLYFGYTGYGDRNYDGPEQLRYVRHIARYGRLPKASACFVCHHPPLYYGLAAACHRLAELSGVVKPVRGVQLLGLWVIFGFLVYAVLILRRFLERRSSLLLATALVALWPYTFLNSVRVHNDVMVCTLMLAGVYHLVRWHQDDGTRQLWFASAFAAASLATKSSGYILVATIGLVVAYRLWNHSGRLKELRRVALPLLLLVAAAGGYALRPRGSDDAVSHSLLGSAYTIHPRDYVGNEPRNFLYFDLEGFVTEPYLLSRSDGSGRQYYWNHLLKSSLFATHNHVADAETAYRYNRRIAELLNVLLLAMIAYAGAALLLSKRDRWSRYAVLWAATLCFFGAHIAFKALVPSAHHNDFRFVYPVIVFAALGYVKAIESYDERRLSIARAGRWMAVITLLGSIVYFLPKYSWVARHLPPKVLRHSEQKLKRSKKEGIPWDQKGNLVIARDEVVEMALGRARDVKQIDVLLDHNDRYELVLVTKDGDQTLILGPRQAELDRKAAAEEAEKAENAGAKKTGAKKTGAKKDGNGATNTLPPRPQLTPRLAKLAVGKEKRKAFKGMARYQRTLDPPVKGVKAVRLRALSGDHCYAIGHLVLR